MTDHFSAAEVDQSEAIRQILTCKIPRYGILEMALPEEGWGVFKGRSHTLYGSEVCVGSSHVLQKFYLGMFTGG